MFLTRAAPVEDTKSRYWLFPLKCWINDQTESVDWLIDCGGGFSETCFWTRPSLKSENNNPSVLRCPLNPSRNTETIIFSCSPSLCVLTWAGLLSQIDQWASNPAGEAIDDRNTAFNSLSLSSRSPLLSATRLLLLSTYVWQLDGSVRYQNISHNDTHLQRRVLIMTSDCL